MLVVVHVLAAVEVSARGARLPRQRRRTGAASSPLLLLLLLLSSLVPAALAPFTLGFLFFFFLLFFLFSFAAAAAAAAVSPHLVTLPAAATTDVAVSVLPRVAGAGLSARDRRRHEVDRALGADRDEQRPPPAGLERDACIDWFLFFISFFARVC